MKNKTAVIRKCVICLLDKIKTVTEMFYMNKTFILQNISFHKTPHLTGHKGKRLISFHKI